MNTIITVFFFFVVVVVTPSYCDDYGEQLSACSSQYCYQCGSQTLNISYPFWGGNRTLYCGRQGFEVRCDQYHYIEISKQKFRVLNISYLEPSPRITIARDDIWEDYCPAILLDQDTVLDHVHFNYGPEVRNLRLFHDCSEAISPKSPNYINCTENGEDISGFYAIDVPEHELRLRNLTDTCKKVTEVPVQLVALPELRSGNLVQALKRGFDVEYNADNILCAKCLATQGICASNNSSNSEQFICLCRDKPRPHTCPLSPSDNPFCSNCKSSGGTCNTTLPEQNLCSCGDDEPQEHPCPRARAPAPAPERKPNVRKKVIIGLGTGFGGIGITAMIFLIYIYRYKKKHAPSPYVSRNISSYTSSQADIEKADKLIGVHVFTYDELEEATNNFDSAKELGDGGFGTVYYGKLQDGRAVAVKRLYENNYKRVEQFMNEIDILTRLRHKNLVTLYGCTSRHSRELLLVYEYISNGTVADHLHGERTKPGALPWVTRLKIAVETASALKYLHASDTIHRDVKTNNILLDDNFCVKVADFGLSRLFPNHVTHVSTAPQGTPGYVDPEYHQCYQLTDKSDVFSFGVVLVELISSKPAVDITRHRQEINLSNLAINKIQNKALHELVDLSLGFESDYKVRKMIYAVAELAFQCLQSDKDLRPCMATVLDTLKDIQSDGYSTEKAEELEISDDVGLLKIGPPIPSPDSRTSTKTTPHTSN